MVYSKKRENTLIFAIRDNLILLNLDNPAQSKVYADHHARITAIAEQPTAGRIAFGDEKGMVTVVTLKQDGTFSKDKDYPFTAGEINQVLWSVDGQRLIGVGAGSDIKANAVMADTGSKSGTILGFDATQLCSDFAQVEKRVALISAGEGKDILVHEGFPFKGQGKAVLSNHTNFINQVKVSPDNSKYVTVSSDKQLILRDIPNHEQLDVVAKAHSAGIYDVKWINEAHFATCSADNTVNIWSVSAEGKLELTRTLDKAEKMLLPNHVLGFAQGDTGENLWAITFGGDLRNFENVISGTNPGASFGETRHNYLISDMLAFNQVIFYASETKVF